MADFNVQSGASAPEFSGEIHHKIEKQGMPSANPKLDEEIKNLVLGVHTIVDPDTLIGGGLSDSNFELLGDLDFLNTEGMGDSEEILDSIPNEKLVARDVNSVAERAFDALDLSALKGSKISTGYQTDASLNIFKVIEEELKLSKSLSDLSNKFTTITINNGRHEVMDLDKGKIDEAVGFFDIVNRILIRPEGAPKISKYELQQIVGKDVRIITVSQNNWSKFIGVIQLRIVDLRSREAVQEKHVDKKNHLRDKPRIQESDQGEEVEAIVKERQSIGVESGMRVSKRRISSSMVDARREAKEKKRKREEEADEKAFEIKRQSIKKQERQAEIVKESIKKQQPDRETR